MLCRKRTRATETSVEAPSRPTLLALPARTYQRVIHIYERVNLNRARGDAAAASSGCVRFRTTQCCLQRNATVEL